MFNTIMSETPEALQVIIALAYTVLLSGLFSFVFTKLRDFGEFRKDMPIAFILIPTIVAALVIGVTVVANAFTGEAMVARYGRVAVALLAAVVMIKFRSEQRNYEELSYLFFLTGFGLLAGMGYLVFATVLYVLVLLIMVVLHFVKFPRVSDRKMKLKVSVPEDLNYEHAFDDILQEYTEKYALTKVKTSDLGTVFTITYQLIMKKGLETKPMIDDIRARNGNLNVVISLDQYE